MKLWAVIPVFNRKAETLACLERLQQLRTEAPGLRVVIADDGSTDGTAEAVRSAYPETLVVGGRGDWWWTGGMRAGVEAALAQGAEAILSLNDDTLLEAGSLARLLRAACAEPQRLWAPLGLGADGQVVESGYQWEAMRGWTSEHRLSGWDARPQGAYATGALAGACVLIPAAAFAAVGSYDQALPHYHADLEFCVRCARAGFGSSVEPEARLQIKANLKNSDLKGARASWASARWMFSYPSGAYHPRVLFRFYTRTHPWGWAAGAFFAGFVLAKAVLLLALNVSGLSRGERP